MPFGLVKALRTFQWLIDKGIQGLDYETALWYIDDIIVFLCDNWGSIRLHDGGITEIGAAKVKRQAKISIIFAKEVNNCAPGLLVKA